ncbi:MAG: hypothetical protein ACK4K0_11375 [Flavobacteriales bacterium]
MRVLFWIIWFQMAFGLFAQVKIKLDAKLTDADRLGEKLNVAWVKLLEDNQPKDSVLTQSGRAFFSLDTGRVYRVIFYRNSYATKFLYIDTRNVPKNYNPKTIKIEVALFREKEGLDVEFLKTQPMGIAAYDDISKKIDWNRDYSRMITEKIIQATLEYARKKKEETKEPD